MIIVVTLLAAFHVLQSTGFVPPMFAASNDHSEVQVNKHKWDRELIRSQFNKLNDNQLRGI